MAALIAAQGDQHRIPHAVSCQALGVSQSWFCKWSSHARAGTLPPRAARRERLAAEVKRLFESYEGKRGSPMITAGLQDAGWRVSKNTVAALMAEQHLAARPKRRRKSTTRPGRGRWRAPDLVKRDFPAVRLNHKWYGDGTEIPTGEGKLHLISVMEAASRRILGFTLSERHDAAAAYGALAMAVTVRGGKAPGVIMHTGQGSEGGFNWSSQHLDVGGGVMGAGPRQRAVRLYRGQMPSPGRPTVAWREDRVRFWAGIARGLSSEEAAAGIGVSQAVGTRWFRHAGGVGPSLSATVSGRYLSFSEREDIALWRAQDVGVREIARRLGRSPSTISRELRRNASTRTYRLDYRASTAQWHAERRARRPKIAKLAANEALRTYVQDRLAGAITRPDGAAVPGPDVRWIGRRHGRRADRRWAASWSPEQISNRLRADFPDDESMRVSHEAIYQALYVQGRGALRRELTACLRTGRALRVPRARTRGRGKKFVTSEIMISERPAEAADRAVPGHWEGDLIVGLNSSAIGTLVERTTRFTMLLPLPPMEGHGAGPRAHNGPALAGHGAEAVRDAIASAIITLPAQLRRSLTWDQGAEMASHAQLRIDTGLAIYFCDPHSPWQRGTNENTNGLLRQYFPKGTDLSRHTPADLAAVAAALNGRPRKTLGWKTPAEALDEFIYSCQQGGVATTL